MSVKASWIERTLTIERYCPSAGLSPEQTNTEHSFRHSPQRNKGKRIWKRQKGGSTGST